MKYLGFILILLLAANTGKADSKKRDRSPQPQANIEDILRAEEDPNFLQYLKERGRRQKEERAAALACEKERKSMEEAYKRAERQFLNEKYKKAARKSAKARKRYVDEPRVWTKQQDKYREEYLAEQSKQKEKLDSQRLARVQKVLSSQRMPASAD